jgi:hypothetical protein
MGFGLCYTPDYTGSWCDWYGGMIAEVRLAEAPGFDSAWRSRRNAVGTVQPDADRL